MNKGWSTNGATDWLDHNCSNDGISRLSETIRSSYYASKDGLAALLYQYQVDILCVVAYGSRSLTPGEKNYHVLSGKLEFLALKWVVCGQFRDPLLRT